jgi:hypothetical protein
MDVYSLMDYLKRCPEEYLQEVNIKAGEMSLTEILIRDTYRKVYGNFNLSDSKLPAVIFMEGLDDNYLQAVHIACWFFSAEEFKGKKPIANKMSLFLFQDLPEVSAFVPYCQWLEDEDRTEEFVRLALKRCMLIPDGETKEEALERLDALDTIKRNKVLQKSNKAFERIIEIRRKMEEAKAREAANVYGRE